MAARSPACWIAGPLVIRMRRAELGGDDHRQAWSCRGRAGRTAARGPAACRAAWRASSTSASCSRTAAGRRTRAARRGRSAASTTRSSSPACGCSRRRRRVDRGRARRTALERRPCSHGASSSAAAQQLQRPARQQHRRPSPSRSRRSARRRPGELRPRSSASLARPAEADERRVQLVAPRRDRRDRRQAPAPAAARCRLARRACRCSSRTIRSAPFLPMPGTCVSALTSAGRHRAAQLVAAMDGEHRQGEPRADAGGGLQQLEQVALVVVGEAVEGERVLADDQGGRSRRLARPAAGERAGGALHGQPDPADLDDGAVGRQCGDPAADEAIIGPPPGPAGQGRRRTGCADAAGDRRGPQPAAAPDRARGGRWPARGRRRRRPASARSSSPSSRVTIAVTWALSARPLPVTAALTSLGRVQRDRQAAPGGGEQRDAGGLGGAHHRRDVVLAEDPLDGDDVRAVLVAARP